jgi:hypothetical protein
MEMELEHRAREQQEQTVPHLSPAADERLKAISKHLNRLTKSGSRPSLQHLNMFGPRAGLANADPRPTHLAQDYSRARSQWYGDPNTTWGQIQNFVLPLLSRHFTGGPRPSYQHGEPFVPGAHLRHTPRPVPPSIGIGN